MLRVLFYGESPLNPTGFGQVNKHLAAAFARVSELVMVASSHYYPAYDQAEYPYAIVPCVDAEKPRNLDAILAHVKGGQWDVFVYQGDVGANNDVLGVVKEECERDPAKRSIFYMPIDTDTAMAGAFIPFGWASVAATYTHHGKSVVKKYVPELGQRMSVHWLGCEVEEFYPLPRKERRQARRELFGDEYLDRFLVLNVNRNQVRKDLARCMAAFHYFHEKHQDSTLYLHSVVEDSGGDLVMQAHLGGCDVLKKPAEVAFSALNLAHAWPRKDLNRLYNAVDCLVSTSYGEGWGLTTTEAMSAGCPVIVPGNTANLDIIGANEARGFLIKSGGDLDHTVFVYGKNNGRPSSIIHTASFLDKLETVYHQRDLARRKAMRARAWCEENSWQKREAEWEALIRLFESEREAA